MFKRKPKVLTPAEMEVIRTKDFFDCILPGTVKFLSDHYIVGDSCRCVWVIREYPPSTEEQAILSQLADRSGVTLIIMPIVAVVSIFNGDINIDTDRLQTMVMENLSAEEQAKLQFVEDTMYAIEDEMTAAGFDDQRVTEAQVLYVLALSDYAAEDGFVPKLVGCFAQGQSDAQLISAVNAAFGTDLSAEDFSKVMNSIRAVYISTSGYVDPYSKNNLDLVEWAKQAESHGWGYVWGTYGDVLSRSLYKSKAEQYPEEVGGYAEFIESHWVGGRTADCVGLIKGYGWLNPDTHQVEYGTNGMPDIGADTMYANATEKGTIDTIPEIPGLAVWHEGHIGIYIGGGQVIHASGTKVGVIQTPIGSSGWTHWLKIPYIAYLDSDVAPAPNEDHIWDVLYAKIGNSYGVAGLIGQLIAVKLFRRIQCGMNIFRRICCKHRLELYLVCRR